MISFVLNSPDGGRCNSSVGSLELSSNTGGTHRWLYGEHAMATANRIAPIEKLNVLVTILAAALRDGARVLYIINPQVSHKDLVTALLHSVITRIFVTVPW